LGLTDPVALPPGAADGTGEASAQIARRAQAIAEGVGATLAHHEQKTGARVEGVVLAGRASLLSGFGPFLSSLVGVPTAPAAPDQLAVLVLGGSAGITQETRAGMPVALGLAMGGFK
jgi:Tfp pilus assembly PilM family ATPase